MPRKARIIVPDCPHHIVQRGHNRQVVFASDGDYQFYLNNLQEWKEKLGCQVYAFCLMTNHVHIIINPGKDVKVLGQLMKRVNGRQTGKEKRGQIYFLLVEEFTLCKFWCFVPSRYPLTETAGSG